VDKDESKVREGWPVGKPFGPFLRLYLSIRFLLYGRIEAEKPTVHQTL
jgi:hypothetical protein